MPVAVADHRDRRRPGDVVAGTKQRSMSGLNTEKPEELTGRRSSLEALGGLAGAVVQGPGRAAVAGDGLELVGSRA